jgi:hypothetical protein
LETSVEVNVVLTEEVNFTEPPSFSVDISTEVELLGLVELFKEDVEVHGERGGGLGSL